MPNIFDAKVWISIFTDSRQAGAIWAVTGLSREPRSIPIKITLNSQLNRGIMAKKTKNIRLLEHPRNVCFGSAGLFGKSDRPSCRAVCFKLVAVREVSPIFLLSRLP